MALKIIKRRVLDTVRRLCETDETKVIVTRMLSGVLHQRMPVHWDYDGAIPSPYADLGEKKENQDQASTQAPVFITARFRTGSTLLWNLFRHVEGITAYYEPLNERRWFDPLSRGTRMDTTHKNVDDYWREYNGLEVLGTYYQQDWISKNLYMDATSWDPGMKRYVDLLVEKARGRPVLQFNRVDFRLPWLRHQFPQATIIHLYRHPRDQWCSSLMDITCFPKDAATKDFQPHDKFYLLMWAQDLKYHFPFLDPREAHHPYETFYYLWKLSYLFGIRYADNSLSFESLVENPDSQIAALFKVCEIEQYDLTKLKALVIQPPVGKWLKYASEDWFGEHESRCETVLSEFFRVPKYS